MAEIPLPKINPVHRAFLLGIFCSLFAFIIVCKPESIQGWSSTLGTYCVFLLQIVFVASVAWIIYLLVNPRPSVAPVNWLWNVFAVFTTIVPALVAFVSVLNTLFETPPRPARSDAAEDAVAKAVREAFCPCPARSTSNGTSSAKSASA